MAVAPIVLFIYNRPRHTLMTLKSLMSNDLANESELFVYSDGPKENADEEEVKKIDEVRKLVKNGNWCRKVHLIESESNNGLARSVIKGVSEVLNKFGKVIVLEDDLVLGKGFLRYMNDALTLYENETNVFHISGYMFPVKSKLPENFFLIQATCWGWGTWQRAWKYLDTEANHVLEKLNQSGRILEFNIGGSFDHYELLKNQDEKKIDSWGILWHANVFLKNGLCLHPKTSLVRNIGFDNSGTHCNEFNLYNEQEITDYISVSPVPVEESKRASQLLRKFLLSLNNENGIRFHALRKYIKALSPKILHRQMKKLGSIFFRKQNKTTATETDKYWSKNKDMLDSWGQDHVWNEIQMVMINCTGKVLDIACGTGIVIEKMSKYDWLEVYGCDISEAMIKACIQRGIDRNHLAICDVSKKMSYPDNFFDYSYSIGSLEYLTEDELLNFINENYRITKKSSFHMLPVSNRGTDEGYINYMASNFYNNSETWWENKFRLKYANVYVIHSGWKNDISVGKWFICIR